MSTVGSESYAALMLCDLCSVSTMRFWFMRFGREGGVALSLPAVGGARVADHFRNSSVRFRGSSLTNIYPSVEE